MKTILSILFLSLSLYTFAPISAQDNDMDGWTIQAGDCNDDNPKVFPGAAEICNNTDDNCNGKVDELKALCRKSFSFELNSSGKSILSVDEILLNSQSACNLVSKNLSRIHYDCDDIPLRTVIVTVSDSASNYDTCHSQLVIRDKLNPIIKCKENHTVELNKDGRITSIEPRDFLESVIDNCGVPSSFINTPRTSFDCDDLPNREVEITVRDKSNNISKCLSKLTIEDKIAPIVVCVPNLTIESEPGQKKINLVSNTFSQFYTSLHDNCGINNISISPEEITLKNFIPTKVITTLTVTDKSNNKTTCTTELTLKRKLPDHKYNASSLEK